jgi:polar amino acid transport system substrate-binding protein
VIASMTINPKAVTEVDFSDRYYFTPGRFAARKGTFKSLEVTPVGMESRKVGVVKGTAHEAYLALFFRDCIVSIYDSPALAREALMAGKVDLIFDDGISLAFWLNGTGSRGCCELRGGPFYDPKFFGDGVAVAVRKGDYDLKRLINDAIAKVRASGQYAEIVRRYFPKNYADDLMKP